MTVAVDGVGQRNLGVAVIKVLEMCSNVVAEFTYPVNNKPTRNAARSHTSVFSRCGVKGADPVAPRAHIQGFQVENVDLLARPAGN